MCNGNVMELANLLRRIALEANGSAVGERGGLTIDGFAHTESSTVVSIEEAGVAGASAVSMRFSDPQYSENGIVKPLRTLDVV